MTIDEFNEVCAFEYRALLEAEQEAMYQEMLNEQLAEAEAMNYASRSYDLDAEAFGNQ